LVDLLRIICSYRKLLDRNNMTIAKKGYTYIDNSNVFIEGQRHSAVSKGFAIDIIDAIDRRIFDFSWKMDYGKLHEFVCGEGINIGCAKLWGSPPPSRFILEYGEKARV